MRKEVLLVLVLLPLVLAYPEQGPPLPGSNTNTDSQSPTDRLTLPEMMGVDSEEDPCAGCENCLENSNEESECANSLLASKLAFIIIASFAGLFALSTAVLVFMLFRTKKKGSGAGLPETVSVIPPPPNVAQPPYNPWQSVKEEKLRQAKERVILLKLQGASAGVIKAQMEAQGFPLALVEEAVNDLR